jgi:hypothetical protein
VNDKELPDFDWSLVADESAGNDQWRCDFKIEVRNRTVAETYRAFKAALSTWRTEVFTVNPERVMKATAGSPRYFARNYFTLNFRDDESTRTVIVDATIWSLSPFGFAKGASHRSLNRLIRALPEALAVN